MTNKKTHLAILGSTGSIGKILLDLISKDKKKFDEIDEKKIKIK